MKTNKKISKDLVKALKGKVKAIVPGDAKAFGAVLSPDGHFVATTVAGRKLGLFFKQTAFAFANAPYFAIDLIDARSNLIIVPRRKRLEIKKIPKSHLWTDYGRMGKTTRSAAAPGGNLPRILAVHKKGRAYELVGSFVSKKRLMKHTLLIWRDGAKVYTASLGVYHARNEKEADDFLTAMKVLLHRSWPNK